MKRKKVFTQRRLVVASGNLHKLQEFTDLLAPLNVQILGVKQFGISLPAEGRAGEGATFSSNAKLKAEFTAQATGEWALSDDSGICIDALGGTPGVDTAHFGGFQKILEAMEGVAEQDRSATTYCVLALARSGEKTLFFEGIKRGHLLTVPQGRLEFGYDSVFVPENSSLTYGEMTEVEKSRVSHRGLAVKLLIDWWKTL